MTYNTKYIIIYNVLYKSGLKYACLFMCLYIIQIPYIKLAQQSNHKLKLYASPWVTPNWLINAFKTDTSKAYTTWANYFVKYVHNILLFN